MSTPLKIELNFYQEHKEEWLQRYINQFAVIKGAKLIGVFPTHDEALRKGASQCGLDSFLIQKIQEKEDEIVIPALTLGLIANANPQ